jgi:hypothetical protein
MKDEDRELIERGFNLLETYIKGRVVSRISLSLIGAGISILGFSNVVPYIAVLIRPELKDVIETENNVFMVIALILIVLGCLLPIFVKIFNHYKKLYLRDIENINIIYGLYDQDSFDTDMIHITNNLSMFDYQIDKIETMYFTLLGSDFYFHNKEANESMKKLCNELSDFNSAMSLRVSPSSGNPNLYTVPRNLYSPPQLTKIQEEIARDCNKLRSSYRIMKGHLDKMQRKNIFRFFA